MKSLQDLYGHDEVETSTLDLEVEPMLVETNPPVSRKSEVIRRLVPVPRFLRLFTTEPCSISRQPRSTSSLDGLRGLAAVGVCIQHYTDYFYKDARAEVFAGDLIHDWWKLPFVLTLYTPGATGVMIFFVIGGFVMTRKSLILVREGDSGAVQKSIAKSLLLRPLRIYIPTAISVLMVLACILIGVDVKYTRIEPTNWQQLQHFWTSVRRFVNPWIPAANGSVTTYNFPTWTIPLEVFNGYMCYILMMILSSTTAYLRRTCFLFLVMAVGIAQGMSFSVAFIAGILLADYDLQFPKRSQSLSVVRQYFGHLVDLFLALACLFAGGLLDRESKEEYGRAFLSPLTPSNWLFGDWWHFLSGTTVVFCAIRKDRFKAFLDNGACQYLGTISFALYLVHIPIWIVLFAKIYQDVLPTSFGSDKLALYTFLLLHPPTLLITAELWLHFIDPFTKRLTVLIENGLYQT